MDEGRLVGAVMELLAAQNFRCSLGDLTSKIKKKKIILIKNASYLKTFLGKFPGNFQFVNADGTSIVVVGCTDLTVCQVR